MSISGTIKKIFRHTETGLFNNPKTQDDSPPKINTLFDPINNVNHTSYTIHDNTGHNKGTGTSIILKQKFLITYQSKTSTFKGRLLTIDLFFRQKQILRITSTYLPASNSNKNDSIKITEQCVLHLNEILNTSHNYHHIILGDFNVQDHSQPSDNTNDPPNKEASIQHPKKRLTKNTFISTLKNHNLIDIHKTLSDSPSSTFRKSNSNNSTTLSTRIDYIFTSNNLSDYILDSDNIELPPTEFDTDHNLLILTLDNDCFNFSPTSATKILSNKKDFIDYKKLSKEDWSLYSESIEQFIDHNWQLSIINTNSS
ncbi:hypothetical protein C1645_825279 [Glomus cerebriforme]|uniref:Endonuclease/exonuclease/phosphatase domain-containing protein n=1 Tax=Glomus cerebriforme TaxID=658196 RepID=A0A397STU2_9GLOM|nr:hypothetical protein C1645_825279 [Glomus cerebriforme]